MLGPFPFSLLPVISAEVYVEITMKAAKEQNHEEIWS